MKDNNSYNNITFPNPFHINKNKHRLSLMKEFHSKTGEFNNIDIGTLDEKLNVFEQKIKVNKASGNVLPQHIIDTYLLFKSVQQTIQELNGSVDSSMLIHDAVIATPEFLDIFENHYANNTIEIAMTVDIVGNMNTELE